MTAPDDSEKRLLERLNALKPSSSISSDGPTQFPSTIHSLVIQPNQPRSREDALADRLRSLREGSEADPAPADGGGSRLGEAVAGAATSASSRLPESKDGKDDGKITGAIASASLLTPSSKAASTTIAPNATSKGELEDGGLDTDDAVLQALLDAEDEPDADASVPPQWRNFDPAAEADMLTKKFEMLKRQQQRGNKDPATAEDAEDDSDGEQMSRDVETILAETLGDLKVSDTLGGGDGSKRDRPREGGVDDSVPKSKSAPGGNPASQARPAETNEKSGSDGGLSLPSVPSDLPAGGATSQTATTPAPARPTVGNFERDMLRRMDALREGGSPAGGGDDGVLNLPSVPTNLPSGSAGAIRRKGGGLNGRVGFTDEDMETWCVACMEDATLACPGCDNDVFCSQCWYDMHKGPSAGYEESLHQPVQFNSERKKNKRVAIGSS